MYTSSAFILATLLALAPTLAAQDRRPGQKPKNEPRGSAAEAVVAGELGAKLDSLVRGFEQEAGGFCGVVAVARKGEVLLQQGYGLAEAEPELALPPNALYDWASVSKQFTAALLLRVIELSQLDEAKRKKLCSKAVATALKGWKKLSLEDPLSRFFPTAPKDKAAVTLRQLLNHSSGIESGFKGEWKFDARQRDSLIELVLGLPMTSKPGTAHDYSNSGYAFVAALLEKLCGVSFEELMREQLFTPTGMKDAYQIGEATLPLARVPKIERGQGFRDRPSEFRFAYGNELTWGYRGCGGVVASTADMLAWDRALRSGKILSKASLEELYRPSLENYALGWTVREGRGGKRVEHSGGVLGVATIYLRHLDEDWVIAIAMSYATKAGPYVLAEQLVRALQDAP